MNKCDQDADRQKQSLIHNENAMRRFGNKKRTTFVPGGQHRPVEKPNLSQDRSEGVWPAAGTTNNRPAPDPRTVTRSSILGQSRDPLFHNAFQPAVPNRIDAA